MFESLSVGVCPGTSFLWYRYTSNSEFLDPASVSHPQFLHLEVLTVSAPTDFAGFRDFEVIPSSHTQLPLT